MRSRPILTQKKSMRLLAVYLSNIQYFNLLKFLVSGVCDSRSFLRSVKGVIDPTVTSRGGGYSHTLHILVCAAQRGRDFEAPDLERGIHFRGVF